MTKLKKTSLFTKIKNSIEMMSQKGVDNKKNLSYFCSFIDSNNFIDGVSEEFN